MIQRFVAPTTSHITGISDVRAQILALLITAFSVLGGCLSSPNIRTETAKDEMIAIRARAESGDADSQYLVGIAYSMGSGGYDENYEKAATWFLRAAEQGHTDATYQVGWMLQNGNGFLMNERRAVEWFLKAAEKGSPEAMYSLGEAYLDGAGVNIDYVLARQYFEKAIEKGDVIAYRGLGTIYLEGLGVERDVSKAREVWLHGAKNGCYGCAHRLGILYRDGIGVERNSVAALSWFLVATSKYDMRSAEIDRDSLVHVLSELEKTQAKSLADTWMSKKK